MPVRSSERFAKERKKNVIEDFMIFLISALYFGNWVETDTCSQRSMMKNYRTENVSPFDLDM